MLWLREYTIPVVATVLLHTVLLLWLGMDFVSKPKLPEVPTPKFVTANIVKLKEQAPPKPAQPTAAQQAQRQAEQRRQQEQRLKEQRAQEQRKQEQQRQERQRQELQKQEKLKAEQAAKERQRLEQERKRAEQEKQKQEQQRLEKQRQEQQRVLEQKAREEALLSSIQQRDQAEQNNAAAEEQAQSYIAVIQQAVIANWSRPASARTGMEVLLDIQMVPNGSVINVNVAKSSGDQAFDRSAVIAVKKAERFPELAKMDSHVFERYFRNFRMRFNPEDLRL